MVMRLTLRLPRDNIPAVVLENNARYLRVTYICAAAAKDERKAADDRRDGCHVGPLNALLCVCLRAWPLTKAMRYIS